MGVVEFQRCGLVVRGVLAAADWHHSDVAVRWGSQLLKLHSLVGRSGFQERVYDCLQGNDVVLWPLRVPPLGGVPGESAWMGPTRGQAQVVANADMREPQCLGVHPGLDSEGLALGTSSGSSHPFDPSATLQ